MACWCRNGVRAAASGAYFLMTSLARWPTVYHYYFRAWRLEKVVRRGSTWPYENACGFA
jgi:hypothetical protein